MELRPDCIHILANSSFYCEKCGGQEVQCVACGGSMHQCPPSYRLRKGYREIPGFPEYAVNKNANVRHIPTDRSCWLERVSKDNHALVTIQCDGKKYTKSAQALRDLAFKEEN